MESKPFIGLMYGWIVILGSIFVTSIILTFVLRMTSMTDVSLTWVSFVIGLIILFAGGIVAGLKGKQRGWIIGGTIGIGFTLFTFIVQYLGYHEPFSLNQFLHHIGYILAATAGGVIGVNTSSTEQT